MGKRTKRAVTAWIVFWCLFGIKASAATDSRILFISSYSYAWEQVQMQIEGIQDELKNGNYTVDYEFMDTKRVDDETALQLFYDGLAYRLEEVEPYDAVILGDDAALVFALQYREELFEGIPLIFEGVNNEELAQRAVEEPLVTGVLEKLSVENNIELGLRINPDATKVVAILDNTLTGEAERKNFYKCAELYPDLEFCEINASKLSSWNLRTSMMKISSDSILIYIVMTEDASGKQYTNRQAIQLITENTKVPVIRMVEGGVGEGIFGGNVASMYQSGRMVAELAAGIINGEYEQRSGDLYDSPNIYCVDANLMKKHGIDFSVLPKDTVIVNGTESFFVRNREALIPCCILISALLVLSGWMYIDNRRRRKLLLELGEAKKIVESASEHDFLTGIPNRSRFMNDLESLIEHQKPCTIMMIDIDNFKKINDSSGHTAGDDALRQIALRLKEMESQILTPYRFAGDEFILILQSCQEKLVEKTAWACRNVFAKPFTLCGKEATICGSIGIASYPKDTEELEQLIICADNAMYQVKKNGKNAFAFYKKNVPG